MREYFKSLPDQSTPLTGERLNGLLNGKESIEKIVVGDIECKNLFDFDNMVMSYGNIDYVNKTITFNGFNNATLNTLKDICPDLKVGETYTFSFKTTSEVSYIYLNGSQCSWWTGTPHTITQAELDNYILFYGTTGVDCVISDIQIEKGSTATDYVPHKKFGYNSQKSMGKIVVDDISCKNLVSELIYNGIGNVGTTYQIVGNEKIIVNSNNNKWAWVEVVIKNVPINQKLTFSCDFVSGGNANVSAIIYDENGNKLAGFDNTTATNGKINMVFSTPTSSIKYRCAANNSGTELTNTATYSNIQLERGTVATEYTPYKRFDSNIHIVTGEEVATNEYIDGKRVYRLRKNIGALPNSTNGSYQTGLSSSYNIIDYSLTARKTNGQVLPIPFISLDNSQYISGYLNDASQGPAQCNFDASSYQLWVDVYYTKN